MELGSTMEYEKNFAGTVAKCKKQQISVTVQPELLKKLDKLASELGQSRASMINIAIYNIVENGLEINKSN